MDSEVVGSAEISALIVHSCSHAVAAWPRWVFRGYAFVIIFLAGVIALVVWQRSDVGPAKRQGLCPKARFGALENSLDQHRSTEPLLPGLSPRPGWPTAGLRAPRLGFSARSAAIASAR